MPIPQNSKILKPWHALLDEKRAEDLARELSKECSRGHVLFGLSASAVATRQDQDDVLFEIEGSTARLAVVHLTWRKETESRWPRTILFNSWDDWVRREMNPAHEEFGDE